MLRIRPIAIVLTVGFILAVLSGGCPPNWQGGTTTKTSGTALKRFSSSDELLSFFRDRALQDSTTRNSNVGVLDYAAAPATAGATGAEVASNPVPTDTSFSTTNIQEVGVDESDVFKSDGTNFYIAKGRSLRIARATPLNSLAEIGRVDFDNPVDSIYLYGQQVIVLQQKSPYPIYYAEGGVRTMMGVDMMWPPYYQSSSIVVAAVDVSNPSAPTVTATNELDGSLASSRLTNDRLILVLAYMPTLPYTLNVLTVNALTVNDVLPMMRTAAGDTLAVAPENVYYPESPAGYSITTVVTLDAANIASQLGSVGVMASAQTIYASTGAVYVTATDYDPNDNYSARTNIHKFALDDQGVASYVASGAAPGYLLNQFSLGEDQGYLRIATHIDATYEYSSTLPVSSGLGSANVATAQADSPDGTTSSPAQDATWPPAQATPASNSVYVLNQTSDGKLEIVGSLTGLAPTETLYSARFLGNRGYLVTFKQIDPLFVVDLTDPTKPTQIGELKIPGYSDYLHPFGDLLIGVGQATGQSDWGGTIRRGVQLSLFNVSDPNNPALVQQVEIGSYQSSSEVSNTPKAFTFLPDQGLLAFPVRLTTTNPSKIGGVEPVLDGVMCYRVTAAGFEELGNLPAVATTDGASGWDTSWGWSWDWTWRRAAFIGDDLYAITTDGVRAVPLASLGDPNTRATVELAPEPVDPNLGGGQGGSGYAVPVYDTGGMPIGM